MPKSISSMAVSLDGNVAPFQKKMDTAGQCVKGFAKEVDSSGSSLLKLSAIGAAAAAAFEIVKAGAEAVSESFKSAAEIQTFNVQLTALTGSASQANRSLDALRKMAVDTPFSLPELVTAEKRLLAVGVRAEAIPTILHEAGDVAAGVGVDIGSIADVFARVANEGSLGSRELREMGRDGIPIAQALAKQFHTSAQGVQELADRGQIGFAQLQQAFAAMTSQGGRFNGILEAQSHTIGGEWHRITASVEDDGARIAQSVLNAFPVAGVLDKVAPAIDKITEIITRTVDIVGHLGSKFAKAFSIGPILDKVEHAIKNIGGGLENVLDYLDEISGTPIPAPKVPAPDPVKITTYLDPSNQTLSVTPELHKTNAIQAGSAASLAARYGQRNLWKPPTSVKPGNPVKIPTATIPAAQHAEPGLPFSGQRTELGDAVMGEDGNYHVKTAAGGYSASLTPDQYQNLRAAERNHQESVKSAVGGSAVVNSFGRGAAVRLAYGGGVSSVDNYKRNRVDGPDSIDKRNLSTLWRTQESAEKIASWNKSHPDLPVAGGTLPHPSSAQMTKAISAANGSQPSGVAAVQRQQVEHLQTANEWLTRIELNTRGSSGTGTTVVTLH
jgi:tape measure domain-containing protein